MVVPANSSQGWVRRLRWLPRVLERESRRLSLGNLAVPLAAMAQALLAWVLVLPALDPVMIPPHLVTAVQAMSLVADMGLVLEQAMLVEADTEVGMVLLVETSLDLVLMEAAPAT